MCPVRESGVGIARGTCNASDHGRGRGVLVWIREESSDPSVFLVCAVSAALFSVGCSSTPKPVEPVADQKAPAVFRVNFETSKGGFIVEVTRDWAPNGADRFYTLVKTGFFDNARFFSRDFRIHGAQFGLAANPDENKKWGNLIDDPVKESNKPGVHYVCGCERLRIRALRRYSLTMGTMRGWMARGLRRSGK